MVPLLAPPPVVPPPPQATVAKTAATGSASALRLVNLIWFPLSRLVKETPIGRHVDPLALFPPLPIAVPVGARVRRRGPRPRYVADPLLRRKVCAGDMRLSSGAGCASYTAIYTQP